MTTGQHNHCFCTQDAIGRPMCCRCWAILIPNGSAQYPKELVEGVRKGVEDIKQGRVAPWGEVKAVLEVKQNNAKEVHDRRP